MTDPKDDQTGSNSTDDLAAKVAAAQKAADRAEAEAGTGSAGGGGGASDGDRTGGGRGTDPAKHDEIEKLQQELEQMTELAKRTMADLQNVKRHQEAERLRLLTMGNVRLIRDLLPVVDNLDRAAQHIEDEGLPMVLSQLHKILIDNGLTPMETVGQAFNPDLHEAMSSAPGEKDLIIEELEKGYMIGETVVRHAKVIVGNGE